MLENIVHVTLSLYKQHLKDDDVSIEDRHSYERLYTTTLEIAEDGGVDIADYGDWFFKYKTSNGIEYLKRPTQLDLFKNTTNTE